MMLKTKIKIKKFKFVPNIEWLLDFSLIIFITANAWINLLTFFPISSVWITSALIYIPLFLYCAVKKTIFPLRTVGIFFIVVFLFLFAYLSNPQNAIFFTRDTYGMNRVFRLDRPIYAIFIFSLYKNPRRVIQALWISSVITTFFGFFEFATAMRQGYWLEYNYAGILVHFSYSLAFGYKMVLPCLVFLYVAYKKKSVFNTGMAALVFLMILLGGSRGQLICIIMFCGIMGLKIYYNSSNIKKYVLVIIMLLAVGLISTVGLTDILKLISICLKNMGISSRTLDAFISGQISDDNSRFTIWKTAIDAIRNGGFWGYGVYGDRPFISPIHYAGYCHNIFLELMVSFGFLPGLLISLFLIIRSFQIIFSSDKSMWNDLFCIMCSVSIQLLLSMSLWHVMGFWAAIEISNHCVARKTRRKLKWKWMER